MRDRSGDRGILRSLFAGPLRKSKADASGKDIDGEIFAVSDLAVHTETDLFLRGNGNMGYSAVQDLVFQFLDFEMLSVFEFSDKLDERDPGDRKDKTDIDLSVAAFGTRSTPESSSVVTSVGKRA